MGTVYRAVDTKLNRPVAVKVLSNELADTAARRRFQREAQTASSLNHPHIVTVHDAGEFEGRQYLVTEFVDGGTLKDWAAAEKRSWRDTIELLLGVADGLAAAHASGITHRDIKPANVLVGKNGYAKLADFGLAKLTEDIAPDEVTRTLGADPTRPGMIVGTIAYMSPEQAAGRHVDGRSDIFSFGVVLFELLAGRRPFEGSPAPALNAEIPLELRALLERALQKNPDDRYPSMRDLVHDLRRLSRVTVDAPVPQRSRKSPVKGVVLIAALVAVGLVIWLASRPAASTRLEYTQLTNFADSVVSPALSPDGRMLSFIRSEEDFWGFGEVYVKLLPNGDPVQLSRDGNRKVGPAVFSPDGARVAYTVVIGDQWDTWTAPVLGGQPRNILANATALTWIESGAGPPHVLFAEWLPERPRMAFFTSTESRSDVRRIYLPEDVSGMVHRAFPSPDGRWVLLVEMDTSGWTPCRVLPFDGSSRGRLVGPAPAECTNAAWSPDGKWIYLSANTGKGSHIWRQRFAEGEPEQLTSGGSEETGIAIAPDGRSLVTSVGNTQTTLWMHDTRGDRQITSEGYPAVVSFSADGKRLYYLSSSSTQFFVSGAGELWTANLETGQRERLLPDFRMAHYTVSRDGKRVVFVRRDDSGKTRSGWQPSTAVPRHGA